ncbi:hypothetical protein SZ30_05815 [Burkholderia pseudomallei]|nr:hypothetical protein SZ30_05815 [Burkholderia pseudomallei]
MDIARARNRPNLTKPRGIALAHERTRHTAATSPPWQRDGGTTTAPTPGDGSRIATRPLSLRLP